MSDAPKVLVVDDEHAIRKIVALRCKHAGYQVDFAADGVEAFNHASAGSYHLIITDHQMPNMNGIELCRRLRSHERHQHTPIIMLTAMADELDQTLQQQLNLVILAKPEGMTGLSDRIARTAQSPAV